MKKLEHLTEPELSAYMRALATAIEWVAEHEGIEKPHFALVLWNDPKVGQYIGNSKRADIITAMREMADRMEQRMDRPRSGDHS